MEEKCLETLPDIASDGAHVTCDGRMFQKLAPETGKARILYASLQISLVNFIFLTFSLVRQFIIIFLLCFYGE